MTQSNRILWKTLSLSRGIELIFGSFQTNSTSAILTAKGDGWAATRSAAGKYTITMTHLYQDCIAALASCRNTADNVDTYTQFGDYDSSAGTIVLKVKTATANADMTADVDNRVDFMLIMKKTSVTPLSTATVS